MNLSKKAGEVDVEYPKELHENRNKLPFIVQKMKIGKRKKN